MGKCLVWVDVSRHFQQYFSYIVAVSFYWWRKSGSTQRKPPTCRKSLTTLSRNVVSSTSRHEQDSNSQRTIEIKITKFKSLIGLTLCPLSQNDVGFIKKKKKTTLRYYIYVHNMRKKIFMYNSNIRNVCIQKLLITSVNI